MSHTDTITLTESQNEGEVTYQDAVPCCQVAQVRWSSAPTATTTPTSTLAHGSTAPTPTWGRTTRWTRLFRA